MFNLKSIFELAKNRLNNRPFSQKSSLLARSMHFSCSALSWSQASDFYQVVLKIVLFKCSLIPEKANSFLFRSGTGFLSSAVPFFKVNPWISPFSLITNVQFETIKPNISAFLYFSNSRKDFIFWYYFSMTCSDKCRINIKHTCFFFACSYKHWRRIAKYSCTIELAALTQ